MTTILGPLPCIGCRALVSLVRVDGVMVLRTSATGMDHVCVPEPEGASYSELRRLYGDEEALVRLAGLRRIDERERARKRDVARRRRAKAA